LPSSPVAKLGREGESLKSQKELNLPTSPEAHVVLNHVHNGFRTVEVINQVVLSRIKLPGVTVVLKDRAEASSPHLQVLQNNVNSSPNLPDSIVTGTYREQRCAGPIRQVESDATPLLLKRIVVAKTP
jgi:hypothetical protein